MNKKLKNKLSKKVNLMYTKVRQFPQIKKKTKTWKKFNFKKCKNKKYYNHI